MIQLKRLKNERLQVNVGDLCNLQCSHCHIGASPNGKNIMSKKVIDDILVCLKNNKIQTLDSVMCRTFLSVGYDGRLYDCDFNLACGYFLKDNYGNELNIKNLDLDELEGKEIITGGHCLACMAGSGSSCSGSLT